MEKKKGNITIVDTELKDSYELFIRKFNDNRGAFEEYYKDLTYEGFDFNKVRQLNRSYSQKGVFRGFHFQTEHNQAKIVEVVQGRVLDIIIDLRKDSESYGKYIVVELSPEKNNQLVVPHGYAHGFIALEDNTIFQYMCDDVYAPGHEGGIIYNDPDINIDWDAIKKEYDIEKLIFSEKDMVHPTIKECPYEFYIEKPVDKKKYLITGYKGQLGYDVKRELLKRGVSEENILAIDKDEMDITSEESVIKVVTGFNPDVIFHCAAWTNVDLAETKPIDCAKVNIDGTRNITNASIMCDAKLVYISTDYVYDGKKDGVYVTTDKTNPLNMYGYTKLAGEREALNNPKCFIARTSWVFGINGSGSNFIKKMIDLSKKYNELNVIDDQVGSPTYTPDLAKTIVDMVNTNKYGIYHVTNSGYMSWADLAALAFKVNNIDVVVNKVSTEEFYKEKAHAERPLNSRMDKSKLVTSGFELLPEVEDAVERFSLELKLDKK
ncbi:MAG: dTDP-4-dehydrorhamnose reductase [Bacilli bacterium]|nr:dTDP-4-dehydrorhamnose reductase [Bacilli bacterium]